MKSVTIDSAPTKSGERHVIMDVLRGFALFGVLVMNVSDFGGEGMPAEARPERSIQLLNIAAITVITAMSIAFFVLR